MIVAEKVMEKEFTDRTVKDAYLNCCKWVSTNIIAINNTKNITYRIQKLEQGQLNEKKVLLTVYVYVDEEEMKERHCNICREMSGSFFVAKNKYMCEVCKLPPYRKRVAEKLKLIKEGLKGRVL